MRLSVFILVLSGIISSNLLAQVNVSGEDILNAINSSKNDTIYDQHFNNTNTHYLNLSVGFFNPVDFAFNLANVNSVNGSPSPAVNFDYSYGISSLLSIGAFANFYRVNAQYTPNLTEIEDILGEGLACADDIDGIDDILDAINCINNQIGEEITIEERLNVFSIGGKISAHKRLIPKLDTYAATYLGFSFNNRENIVEGVLEEYAADLLDRSSVEVPKFMYYVNGGARYYFNHNLGVYGEVGYGNVHLAKLGVTYRF